MTTKQLVAAAGSGMLGLSVCASAQTADVDPAGGAAAQPAEWTQGTHLMPHLPRGWFAPGDNPGDLIPGSLTNLEAQIGANGNLGIQYLNGTYWVSTRGVPGNHRIHGFDAAGVLGVSTDQVAGAMASAWGYRDGASDGTFLYFGWEGGVARHNANGTGGVVIIFGPPPGIGVWRALAHDPDLDGGTGGFWVQSFQSALITTDMNGALLTSFPNNGSSLYGLALAGGRLFGHGTGGDIIEIDRNDGSLIGTVFNVASAFTSFGSIGGLSEVPGGGFGSGNAWDLAVLAQGTPDEFAVFELEVHPPCYPDCDPNGILDLCDFLCFQGSFVNGEPYACDCDTSTGPLVCDLFDFLCFQGAFVGGCP